MSLFFTPEELHVNFLKLHAFLHPEEPIKDWVKNDPEYHGEYHSSIDWVYPVVEKIETLSTKVKPLDFIIANGMVSVKVYESIAFADRYYYHSDIVYAENGMDKTTAIYKACVNFINWLESTQDMTMLKNPYMSPYSLIYKKSFGTRRTFPDKVARDHLITMVANTFKVDVEEINGKSRKQEVVKARQLCMTMLHLDDMSLTQIGEIFRKNHATVIHGKRAILNIIETKDKEYYDSVITVLDTFGLKEKFEKQAL
jgi:hypothetical protein